MLKSNRLIKEIESALTPRENREFRKNEYHNSHRNFIEV